MFHTYEELSPDMLSPERFEWATAIGKGLAHAEIVEIVRRNITLRIAGLDEPVVGDVARSGFTVYLGGFDWVTFPTPSYLLQKFPDLMPLPQQVFSAPEPEDGS